MSLGELTNAWSRKDLLENEGAPEDECTDLAAARRLFRGTEAAQIERVAVRAAEDGRQPGAAPPKPRAEARLQRKIAEESLGIGTEAKELPCRKIRGTPGAPVELCMAAELGAVKRRGGTVAEDHGSPARLVTGRGRRHSTGLLGHSAQHGPSKGGCRGHQKVC